MNADNDLIELLLSYSTYTVLLIKQKIRNNNMNVLAAKV